MQRTAATAGPLIATNREEDSMRKIDLAHCLGTAGLCASTVIGATAHADSAIRDNDGDEDLDTVTVTGVRSLLRDKLGDTPLNTPQSVTVVSSELISEQGATRLQGALH